jgi:hypothetical protein
MNTCPVCDKPVDPLRSRFVGVRDGRVVAYCSAQCAGPAGAVGGAAGRAVSPASGVPTRIATPPAGVPAQVSGVPGRTPPASDASGPPRPVTPAPGVPVHLDSGPVIEILHEPTSGVVASAPDARADAATTARTEPRARHPDEVPIAAFWAEDKARSAATRDDGPAAASAGGNDGPRISEDVETSAVAPHALADSATTTGGAEANPPGSGAAAELREGIRTREHRAAARGDSTLQTRDRPESDGEDLPPPRRRWPVVLLVLVLLGAGGGLLYHFFGHLLVHDGHAADSPHGAVPLAVAPAARVEQPRPSRPNQLTPAAPVDLSAAVELARAALRRDLAATSPRVQRLAAAALARTQDAAACDLLAAQIGLRGGGEAMRAPPDADDPASSPANNDIARLDLAYALARGGDRRGAVVLGAALGAPRGEARDEAARLLALLGDHRAVPHLLDLLAVEQRRLGAAEHLAHLAEPHALKVLDQLRSDPRRSADDKARAVVALGVAGRSDVADELRGMLGDPHFNAFAAAALAGQGDRAARSVLEHQLASPPLRVLAARALRRLEPAIDPRPLLPPLLDVVRAGRDIDRIPAAEAVLLLAGPAAWSAYD